MAVRPLLELGRMFNRLRGMEVHNPGPYGPSAQYLPNHRSTTGRNHVVQIVEHVFADIVLANVQILQVL